MLKSAAFFVKRKIFRAARLHSQGLITAADGGYLTPFGMTMLEHLQHLLVALKPN